jgi:hypothetical protein
MWLLPKWFAELVPPIDDRGSVEAWPGMVQRFAEVVGRAATVLDTAAWERVKFRCLSIFVREAKSHTTDAKAAAVCETVIGLCDRSAAGEVIPKEAWESRAAETWESQAEDGASRAAEGSAEAAKWAAAAAEAQAAEGAAAAAAAEAAKWAARAAAAETLADGDAWEAWAAAWDRMTSAILDAIEAETK